MFSRWCCSYPYFWIPRFPFSISFHNQFLKRCELAAGVIIFLTPNITWFHLHPCRAHLCRLRASGFILIFHLPGVLMRSLWLFKLTLPPWSCCLATVSSAVSPLALLSPQRQMFGYCFINPWESAHLIPSVFLLQFDGPLRWLSPLLFTDLVNPFSTK